MIVNDAYRLNTQSLAIPGSGTPAVAFVNNAAVLALTPAAGGPFTVTLPNPTNTGTPRVLWVANVSTTEMVVVSGVWMRPQSVQPFFWNGTAWRSLVARNRPFDVYGRVTCGRALAGTPFNFVAAESQGIAGVVKQVPFNGGSTYRVTFAAARPDTNYSVFFTNETAVPSLTSNAAGNPDRAVQMPMIVARTTTTFDFACPLIGTGEDYTVRFFVLPWGAA